MVPQGMTGKARPLADRGIQEELGKTMKLNTGPKNKNIETTRTSRKPGAATLRKEAAEPL